MGKDILVFAETRNGNFRIAAFEACSAGRKLADSLSSNLIALAIKNDLSEDPHQLDKYGVDTIYLLESDLLKNYSSDAYAHAIAQVAKLVDPYAIILPHSAVGRDIAGKVAGLLDCAIVADVTKMEVTDGIIEITRPVYAGKAYTVLSTTAPLQLITIRPKMFSPVEVSSPAESKINNLSLDASPDSIKAVAKELKTVKGAKMDLTEADIIVSGGRGMGGPENFKMLEELADLLGGVVGASRAAVDAGWRPHSDQVGQTGKVVTPNLYIAVGISGAIQHLAGMSNSKVIVAINKDPEAPIFKVADYGIVGDLFKVIPAMIEEVKKLKG